MPAETSPRPAPAPRTARAVARTELTRAILDSAGRQLAAVGPAALSLRAVARDLEMASSAVYRYVESRDALLTALIVEAYDELGEAVEQADAERARDDLAGRWRALAHAVRDWAVAHPHRYALTYGSPVPGYAAPYDTVGPATRTNRALLTLLSDAERAGRTPLAGGAGVSRAEQEAVAPVAELVDPAPGTAYVVAGLQAWATVVGQVSLELFGHLHRGVLNHDVHYETVVGRVGEDLGLV